MIEKTAEKGISYSDRELGFLMNELDFEPKNASYAKSLIDTSKRKWPFRFVLLSYLFISKKHPTKKEIADFSFPLSNQRSLSYILNLPNEEVRARMLYPKEILPPSGVRNLPSDLAKKGLLVGKNGIYALSEDGKKVALILYHLFLRAQGIATEHIVNFVLRGIIPEEKEDLFRRVRLSETDNQPSYYASALSEIIDSSHVLKSDIEERTILEGVVLAVRNHLMKKIRDSESLVNEESATNNLNLLPSEWIYRLQAQKEGMGFEPTDWINKVLSDSDEEFDCREFCSVLVAEPGSGKTNWMIQSAVEVWNSQQINPGSASERNPRDREILPIFLELRGVDVIAPIPDSKQILFFKSTDQVLWPIAKSHSRKRLVLSHLLRAVLESNESVSFIEKALGEFEGRDKQFVLFLDGWDELPSSSRPLVSEWIEYLLDEEIPIVISSREEDEPLRTLTKDKAYSLDYPTDDDILKFMGISGMRLSRDHLWNLRQVLGPITPLNLKALAAFPKLTDLPSSQVTLYRNLIIFQGLREAYNTRTLQDIQSKEELDNILSTMTYNLNNEEEVLIGSLIQSINHSDESLRNEYAIMNFVPRVAYHELLERNMSISYDQAVRYNPLLKPFLDSKLTQDMIHYPEIRQKHLILYLAAEHVFNEYLAGRFASINGDSRILYYLLEIIRQSERSLPGDELLKPEEKLAKIILDAESRGDKIQSIKFPEGEKAPEHFHCLFYSLVNYWLKARELQNPDLFSLVIAGFTQVISISVLDSDVNDFIQAIYRIESSLNEIDLPALKANPSPDTILIETIQKWPSGYLEINSFVHAFSGHLNTRLWLLPWIARVNPQVLEDEILNLVLSIPDATFQSSIYRLFLLESPSNEVRLWVKSLIASAERQKAPEMIGLLIQILPTSATQLEDDEFERTLHILQEKELASYHALGLIRVLGFLKTTRRQKELVKQLAVDTKLPIRKRFFALAGILEIDGMDLDETFKVIEAIDEPKWVGLILSIIAKEYHNETVRNQALLFSQKTINMLEGYLTEPVQLFRISQEGVGNVSEDYVNPVFYETIKKICETWWANFLSTFDDAISILEKSLEKRESIDDFYSIDFKYYDAFDKVVEWISTAAEDDQRRFILKCLELGLDLTLRVPRTKLWPILQKYLNDEEISEKIIDYYKRRPYPFLAEFPADFWIKNVVRFPKEIIFRHHQLLLFWLQGGNLSSIEEALEVLKTAWDEQILYDVAEEFLDWISKQSLEEQLSFLIQVFELDIDYGLFHKILDNLEPIKRKSPKLYKMLLDIATNSDLHFEMERNRLENYYSYNKRYNADHAYLHLDKAEQNQIIRPLFEKVLKIPDWHNQFILPLLKEFFRVADDISLKMIADAMDQEPVYIHELVKADKAKAMKLKELLKDPYSISAIERSILGIEEYLDNLSIEQAKDLLQLYSKRGNLDLPLCYLENRDELRDLVLDKINQIPMDWNSFYSELYIDAILKKGDEKSIQTVANLFEQIPLTAVIRWMSIKSKSPQSDFLDRLRLILNYLKSSNLIMLTIYVLMNMSMHFGIDMSEVWETHQYLGLSGNERIELKSRRWNPNQLIPSSTTDDPS